ncbi:MAG: hypothetical protein HYU51_16300 [Candidatus Rokubacteria bacterium]|nr:hypothetical protein [Candidatus Rokubacteria bacterium]
MSEAGPLVVAVAGVTAAIEAKPLAFRSALAARLAAFAVEGRAPDFTVEADIVPGRRGGGGPGAFALDARALELVGPGFEGRYDRVERRGAIRQPASLGVFHRFLAGVFGLELPSRGGLLVHAAALTWGGRAHVFFGPSGSGKTTLARRRRHGVLSDEVVALRVDGETARAHGTPWRGRNLSAPLGALHRLRRTGTAGIRALPPALAARELMQSLFVPAPDGALGDAVLGTLARLVPLVPVFELSVVRGRPFWPLVDAAIAADRA